MCILLQIAQIFPVISCVVHSRVCSLGSTDLKEWSFGINKYNLNMVSKIMVPGNIPLYNFSEQIGTNLLFSV